MIIMGMRKPQSMQIPRHMQSGIVVPVVAVDLCGREGALSRVTLVLAREVLLDLFDVLPFLVLGGWQNCLQKLVEVYTEIVCVSWV